MHHRRWLTIAGFAIVLALVPSSRTAEQDLDTAARMDSSEAQAVATELAERFHSPFVGRLLLVVRGLPSPGSPDGRAAVETIRDELRKQPYVAAVISYADWHDDLFLGTDGGTFLIIGIRSQASVESLIPPLRANIATIQRALRARHPRATLELTGETPLNFDIRKASSDDARLAETRALPVILILLLVAFGSAISAALPLLMGWLAIIVTMGSAALVARYWHLSILVQNLATMLGLGLGIDYALLMVSRFREAIDATGDAKRAAEDATRIGGHTLLVSASTVAIGFAALMTVPISDIRSIGAAGFFVAVASLLMAVTMLPGILELLGHRIDMLRIPFLNRAEARAKRAERWRRWTRKVTAHPWRSLLFAGVPLLIISLYSLQLSSGLPRDDWLPPEAESVRALHALQEMRRAAIVQSARVVLELPADAKIDSTRGFDALQRLSEALARDPRAARVISLSTLMGVRANARFIAFVPEQTRRAFLRSDAQAALIEVLPKDSVSSAEQVTWVRELRKQNVAALCGVEGARIRIGGIPALNADYEGTVSDRSRPVMAWVVVGTLVALLIGFRSLFVAVKAILLNLLSVGASLGLLVLVFQEGHGCRLVGLERGTGGVFPIVPILTFAIVFGLSMDYEVFLVSRVLEARRSGAGELDAIAEGVAKTAGIITSAAAIMIAVFTAFALGSFLIIKMIGFALAVAVLIDATLVRIVIGPALLAVAGEWNWWPGGVRR